MDTEEGAQLLGTTTLGLEDGLRAPRHLRVRQDLPANLARTLHVLHVVAGTPCGVGDVATRPVVEQQAAPFDWQERERLLDLHPHARIARPGGRHATSRRARRSRWSEV